MGDVETVIRSARTADAEALAQLAGELGYPSSAKETMTRLGQLMVMPGNSVLVAENVDGRVVGWAHVFGAARVESDGFAELGGLVVMEDLRGRGIGTRLVAAAETWALENGYHTLRIRSRAERGDTHRFFEGLGYACSKTQRIFDRRLSVDR